jgi:hypothetical protein
MQRVRIVFPYRCFGTDYGPNFKGQTVFFFFFFFFLFFFFLDCLTLGDGTERLFRNVAAELPSYAA